MSENLSDSGTNETPIKRRNRSPGKRNKAGAPKSNQFEASLTENIKLDGEEVKFPEIDNNRIAKGRLKLENIPEPPYLTKNALWNTVFTIQNINIERATLGIKQFADWEILKRTKMTAIEVERIIQSDDYKKFRISKSAGVAQQTIADIVPSLRVAMVEFMGQLRLNKKCEKCGRVSAPDLKKMHEGLQFVVFTMDKFGLPKIDTSFAENTDEMDTTEVINEAIALAKEIITWPNFADQRFINAFVEPGTGGEAKKTIEVAEPLKDGPEYRPDEVVPSVRVPEATVLQQEEIPSDDIEQPAGEERMADGGLHSIRSGEAPISEDTEERSFMAFGGEE